MLSRLVSNSRPQVICLPWPLKVQDYRRESAHPPYSLILQYALVILFHFIIVSYIYLLFIFLSFFFCAPLTPHPAARSMELKVISSVCRMC